MPRTCTTCTHPNRETIDTALLNGAPSRRIAAQFSLSEASVRRHKEHVPLHLATAVAAQEVSHADALLRQLTALTTEARRIKQKAEKAGDYRTALSGVRELVRIVELLARVHGELKDSQTVNILVDPQWHSMRAAIVGALAPYPEAQGAVLTALQRGNGHG